MGVRQSKERALVTRPITNSYHLDCCYATKYKYQDLQKIEMSSDSGLIPDLPDRWDPLSFTVLAQGVVSPRVILLERLMAPAKGKWVFPSRQCHPRQRRLLQMKNTLSLSHQSLLS